MAVRAVDSHKTYAEALEITAEYLGPTAERFINRQIRSHLHKKPRDITRTDLLQLLDWIRIAFSLLTRNRTIVDDYISRLERLAKGSSAKY
jgi:hypothetical protein